VPGASTVTVTVISFGVSVFEQYALSWEYGGLSFGKEVRRIKQL